MIDVKTADRELMTYIRPQTFPVAIRMLKPGEAIPERAKRPARDFKKLSMNCQVIDECLQLHGGYGYMLEYPIARMYADARVGKIYGGSNEIMKEIIARGLVA